MCAELQSSTPPGLSGKPSASTGLDPALLAALGDLELVARVIVDGTLSGLHNSPFHGYSAEFSQYRHYRPGDDLKYVDWKLFARTDRLYTKQFRETTNLVAQIVVDASESMAFRGRTGVAKLDYARMAAAALAYLIAGQGDAVGLVIYDESVRQYLPSRIGQSHLRGVLAALAKMQASGTTASTRRRVARRAVDLLRRRGLLDPRLRSLRRRGGGRAELRRAARMGHEVAVFHVLTRDELEFPFGQEVELEDLESGRTVLTGSAAGATYRHAFAEFLERWHARCARDRHRLHAHHHRHAARCRAAQLPASQRAAMSGARAMIGWLNPGGAAGRCRWRRCRSSFTCCARTTRRACAFPSLRFVQPSRTAAVRMRLPSDVR